MGNPQLSIDAINARTQELMRSVGVLLLSLWFSVDCASKHVCTEFCTSKGG